MATGTVGSRCCHVLLIRRKLAVGGDIEPGVGALPTVTPELFLEAGLIVAERASLTLAEVSPIEDLLRQAVLQANASRGRRQRW